MNEWRRCLFVSSVLVCGVLSAKTIALWTLNADREREGYISGRSAVSFHSLTPIGQASRVVHSAGVGIPPNLDVPDGLSAADFANDGVAFSIKNGYLDCETVGSCLEMTKSWTIEGWFKMNQLPGVGGWLPIFHTRPIGADGWLFTIRQRTPGIYDYELFATDCVDDGTRFLDGLTEVSLTEGMHHLALVYDHDATGIPGKGVWTFYIDGVQVGTPITNTRAITTAINPQNLQFMGRSDLPNSFDTDYVRISDEALPPERFLCATPFQATSGGDGTLGFWRLDQDGEVENLVCGNLLYNLSAGTPLNHPVAFKAFETCPNASAQLPANTGSCRLFNMGNVLILGGLGVKTDYDKAFTLEGWFYMPDDEKLSTTTRRLLYGTRQNDVGFLLWYNFKVGAFSLYARASDTPEGAVQEQVGDVCFPRNPTVRIWNNWRHVALTYDPAGGSDANGEARGVWELFVDGESLGTLMNSLPSSVTHGQSSLLVGGRPGDDGAVGYVDTVRLTKRVLAPSEFLCTEGGTSPSAEDVEGLWPLGLDGLVCDGTDLTGNHPLWQNYDTDIHVDAEGAVETIPNPPAGLPGGGRNDGSVVFPNSGKCNCLIVENIHRNLDLAQDFTVEAWFRFDILPNGWHSLFINGTDNRRWCLWIRKMEGVVRYMLFVQHANYDFSVPDNTRFSSDAEFPVPTDGAWHHHALVFRARQGAFANGSFELFVDGNSLGTIDRNADFDGAIDFGRDFASLMIGGRTSDGDASIRGAVDLLRVSACALNPGQFLRATPTTPAVAAKTVAYWKLDANNIYESQVDEGMGFNFVFAEGVDDQFDRRVRNPDTTPDFAGDPFANAGSVRISNGDGLYSHGTAFWVLPDRTFTLEGWMKLATESTRPFPQTLATTDRIPGGFRGCWELSLDDAQTFRLTVRSRLGYPTVSRTFAVPAKFALPGAWRHVALTHEIVHDRWTLYLDGTELGVADAAALPSTSAVDYGLFAGSLGLGGGGVGLFDGLLDTWRLSYGVRPPEDFLFKAVPKATMLILR